MSKYLDGEMTWWNELPVAVVLCDDKAKVHKANLAAISFFGEQHLDHFQHVLDTDTVLNSDYFTGDMTCTDSNGTTILCRVVAERRNDQLVTIVFTQLGSVTPSSDNAENSNIGTMVFARTGSKSLVVLQIDRSLAMLLGFEIQELMNTHSNLICDIHVNRLEETTLLCGFRKDHTLLYFDVRITNAKHRVIVDVLKSTNTQITVERSFVESVKSAIIITDLQNKIIFANSEVYENIFPSSKCLIHEQFSFPDDAVVVAKDETSGIEWIRTHGPVEGTIICRKQPMNNNTILWTAKISQQVSVESIPELTLANLQEKYLATLLCTPDGTILDVSSSFLMLVQCREDNTLIGKHVSLIFKTANPFEQGDHFTADMYVPVEDKKMCLGPFPLTCFCEPETELRVISIDSCPIVGFETVACQRMFSLMACPVIQATRNMTIIYANEQAAFVFGYTVEELIGQNVRILMGPRDAHHHDSYVNAYRCTGSSYFVNKSAKHLTGKHKDGSVIHLYMTVAESSQGIFTSILTDVSDMMVRQERADRLSSLPALIVDIDSRMRVRGANPMFLDAMEYSDIEIMGADLSDFVYVGDAPDAVGLRIMVETAIGNENRIGGIREGILKRSERLTTKYDSGSVSHDDDDSSVSSINNSKLVTLVGKGGKRHVAYLTATKSTQGYSLVFVDVTCEVQVTSQLRWIVQSVSACIIVTDSNYIIEFANKEALHTFEYRFEELEGHGLEAISHELVYSLPTSDERKHDSKLRNRNTVVTCLTKHQNRLKCSVSVSFSQDKITFVLTNVTEAQELQTRLNRILNSTESLIMMFESESFEPIMSMDACSLFSSTLLSKSAERLFRSCNVISQKTMTLYNLVSICDKESGVSLVHTFKDCQRKADAMQVPFSGNVECKLVDESWYVFSITFLTGSQVFLTGRSVTSEVQLRKELRNRLTRDNSSLESAQADSDYIRSVFSYVAHEYRNMFFGAQQLCEDIKDKLQAALSVEMSQVLRLHERMGRLFDDVLIMQKMDAGKLEYPEIPFDVNDVLQDLHTYCDTCSSSTNIKCDFIVDDSTKKLQVVGCMSHFFQAASNIISNSFKYNNEDGKVIIHSRYDNGMFKVEIRDTGLGIPEKMRDQIFLPYSRLENGMHKRGTGLGLSIAKDFIEKGHHGTITVGDNVVEGKGTTFVIAVPGAYKAESKTGAANSVSESPRKLISFESAADVDYDIMIVDDDEIIRKTMCSRLQRMWSTISTDGEQGLRVIGVTSGEDAVRMIVNDEVRVSLISMDQNMGNGRITGSEAIKTLRDAGYSGKIVSLSGCENDQEIEHILEAGADRVLLKGPSVFSEFASYLEACVIPKPQSQK